MKAVSEVVMQGLRSVILVSGLVLSLFSVSEAQASEAVRLKVTESGRLRTGDLSDGTVIARGTVLAQNAHSGFHVWSDAQIPGSRSDRYILIGVENGGNRVRVRLENDGWSSGGAGEKGIRKGTTDEMAEFNVVADGNQKVVADRYRLELKADTISASTAVENSADVGVDSTYIDVTQAVKVSHVLNAVQSRISSKSVLANQTLLEGSISAEDGSENKYAMRFTPGTCKALNSGKGTPGCVLSGRNNDNHSLAVSLNDTGWPSMTDENGWLVTTNSMTVCHYEVRTLNPSQDDIPADIYTVSVDAGIWTD